MGDNPVTRKDKKTQRNVTLCIWPHRWREGRGETESEIDKERERARKRNRDRDRDRQTDRVRETDKSIFILKIEIAKFIDEIANNVKVA